MILLHLGFLLVHLQEFDGLSKFVTSWIYFSESHFVSSEVCSQFCGCVVEYLLYILAAMDVSVTPPQFMANPRSLFLGKGQMHLFVHLLCFDYIRHYSVGAVYRRIPWSSIIMGFLFLIFLSTETSPSCICNILTLNRAVNQETCASG